MIELIGTGGLLAIVGYFAKQRLDKLDGLEAKVISIIEQKPTVANYSAEFDQLKGLLQGLDSKLDTLNQVTQDVAVIKRDLQTIWRRFDELNEGISIVNSNIGELVKYTQGLSQKIHIIRMKSERQGNWNYSESEQNLLNQ